MTYSKKKKVKIFGVPLDLGKNKLGVDMGPNALRHAGLFDAFKSNNIHYEDYGDLSIGELKQRESSPFECLKEIVRISDLLANLTFEAMQKGYIPIVIGGDHSVSIGSIAGASKHANKLGVLWLDCHPDANTPGTSPSGNIHGMTVAISLGYGYPELIRCFGFKPKVLPEDIIIIGAKDIDKAEHGFLENHGIEMFTIYDIEKIGIVNVVDRAFDKLLTKCDSIHVSFDVDVLDPLIAPGTGIVSRGGLSYREISFIMDTMARNNIISSIDIIEINPLLDIKNQTAELAIELLITALGGSYGDYQRHYLKNVSI